MEVQKILLQFALLLFYLWLFQVLQKNARMEAKRKLYLIDTL